MKMKMFALVSNQGTACSETALCQDHLSKKEKESIPTPADVVDRTWQDCSENDALSCQVCGVQVGL